jgi:hypothetical protein
MTDGNPQPQISSLLMEKQSIALCLPTQTTLDAAAAALALYHALIGAGKAVTLSSSEPLNPEFALLGQEHVKNTISAEGDVLIVSVPFKDNGVENVTYNVENDRVNIVIKPEDGAQRFDPKNVEYTFSGGKAELVVMLYAPTLDSLGDLYTQNIDQFQGVTIINIDRHFTNAQYGAVNMVDKRSPSMCLMILDILDDMKIELTKELATLLFTGISSATNNFSSHSVNADTFKAAAYLLEKGAEKRQVRPQMPGLRQMPPAGMGSPQQGLSMGMGMPMGQPAPFQDFNQNQPMMNQGGFIPQTMPQPIPAFNGNSDLESVFKDDAPEDSFDEDLPRVGGTVEFKEASVPKPAQNPQTQQGSHQQNGQQNQQVQRPQNEHSRNRNRNRNRNGQGQQNQQGQRPQNQQPQQVQRPQQVQQPQQVHVQPEQTPKEMPAQDWLKPQIFNNPQGNSRV